MRIQPITLKTANAFVVKFHRHHREVVGAKFSIGLFIAKDLKGVAICGRPVARKLDDGLTVEVNRLCVETNVPNGCSKLYGACSRIAKEMGFNKIITYILASEPGTTLKASGWLLEADNVGGITWNSSKTIKRTNTVETLFGSERKYPMEMKQRWSKTFSTN